MMGKAKKRGFQRGNVGEFHKLSRQEAIEVTVQLIKQNNVDAYSFITLFGLSAEELLEAGVDYEEVVKMGSILT